MLEIQFVDFAGLGGQLAAMAILVETLTQAIKVSLKDTNVNLTGTHTYYLSIVIGIIAAVLFNVSLFDTENATLFYTGTVVCGLIAARGGNYIFDIIKAFSKVKDVQDKK